MDKNGNDRVICAKRVVTEHEENMDEFYKKEKENRVKSEIKCLMEVSDHQNIVAYIDYAITEKDKTVWIFMEYCEQGDLHSYLKRRRGQLRYAKLLSFMIQAATAVSYLHNHDRKIIHRDIKTKNFLLQGEVIKLCDFGLSKLCPNDKSMSRMQMNTWAGTPAFMAPELLMIDDSRYDCSVDIFSLGLVFSVLIKYRGQEDDLMPKSGTIISYI